MVLYHHLLQQQTCGVIYEVGHLFFDLFQETISLFVGRVTGILRILKTCFEVLHSFRSAAKRQKITFQTFRQKNNHNQLFS